MVVQYSDFVKDSLIATEASALTQAVIEDLESFAPESKYFLQNFFLNSLLTAKYNAKTRIAVYHILKRCQFAFTEYQEARRSTLDFIAGGSQSIGYYTRALHHWEIYLGQCYHVYCLISLLGDSGKLFRKNDGSALQRLNAIYNQLKHVESRIENNQIPDTGMTPVWLTNDGLKSTDSHFTFVECADMLKELSEWADILQNPATAASRNQAES